MIRTGENALAAGTVATVQYFVIENMISKQFEQLRGEIRLFEQRTTRNIASIIEDRLKHFTTPPRASKGIDAQAFKIAEGMLF